MTQKCMLFKIFTFLSSENQGVTRMIQTIENVPGKICVQHGLKCFYTYY